MSIILDALKRAESLRKKNQPPNLMSGATPLQPANRRVMMLVVAFLLAGLGAWFWRPDATVSDVPTPQAKLTERGSAGVQIPQTDANTPSGVIDERPVLENEPVHQTHISSGTSQVPSTAVPVLNQTLTQPAMLQSSSQAGLLAKAQSPQQAASTEPVERPIEPINPIVDAPIAVEAPRAIAVAPAAEIPPVESPASVLPTIFELDYPIRLALPKMLVSMYVYNSNPEFRFLIVNGKKVRQGEQVEASVTFAEIRRDGVECEYQGTRFFFPRNSQ